MKKIFFPCPNGVVCQFDGKRAISLIDCKGSRSLMSENTKNKIVFWHFPFARGLQYFFCGLVAFFRCLFWASDICEEKKKGKDLTILFEVFAGVLGVISAGLVLGLLPGKLGYWLVGADGSTLLRNFIISFFRLILFAVFLILLKCFPSVRELFRFNRASDLVSIYGENCREKIKNGLCEPLNFLNFLVLVFFLDIFVVTFIGVSLGFFLNFLVNLAIFLLVIMVAYEILWLLDKSGLSFLKSLSFVTSFFVTMKPSTTHIETVLTAETEINFLTTQKERGVMNDKSRKPFSLVYTEVRNKLLASGVKDKSDADWIIANVLGKNRGDIRLVESVSEKEYKDIMKATNRRANGESVDNIFGYTEFYGLRFEVNKKVLTPRMETEILVEEVLKFVGRKTKVLDLGTGSGAIAVSIAKNSEAEVTAIDISKAALLTAQVNAKNHNVKIEFINSDLFNNLKKRKKFDIIVSNPPYIPTKDIAKLDVNVKECDPKIALDGGEDGLNFYREITKGAVLHLTNGGMLFYEIGKGQASAVRKIMKENGFKDIKVIKDYNKIERVIYGRL